MKKLKLKAVHVNTKSMLPYTGNNLDQDRVCVTEHDQNGTKQNKKRMLSYMEDYKFHTLNRSLDFQGKFENEQLKTITNRKVGKSQVRDIDLKLRLDLDRRVPVFVDKSKLGKTIQKFTISNYNNKYNIYYKKRKFFPSIRSMNRTVKYNVWQTIFIQSLRGKQREEMEMKYKLKQMKLLEKARSQKHANK